MNRLRKELTLPAPLFVTVCGNNAQIYLESGLSPQILRQLELVVASRLQELGHDVYSGQLLPTSNVIATGQMMLQVEVAWSNGQPDIDPLVELLLPKFRIPASLSIRHPQTQLGVEYTITLPTGYRFQDNKIRELLPNGPKGRIHQGNTVECYLSDARTYNEIWREAQRVAATISAFIVGNVTSYRKTVPEPGR